jgi:hypothetical protein
MAQLFRTLRHPFRRSARVRPEQLIPSDRPVFDKKFRIIITYMYRPGYTEMLDWVNQNSKGEVSVVYDVWPSPKKLYIGFTDSDDALFFKIKYSA